jgi:hypothetical protein
MRLELYGTPTIPVLASAITSALIARSNELYGSLPGIEEAVEKIAERLLEIAVKEADEYLIVIGLSDDGGYYFGVKAPRHIERRPRCRSWDGPGNYLLEVDSLGSGSPFNRHLVNGWL